MFCLVDCFTDWRRRDRLGTSMRMRTGSQTFPRQANALFAVTSKVHRRRQLTGNCADCFLLPRLTFGNAQTDIDYLAGAVVVVVVVGVSVLLLLYSTARQMAALHGSAAGSGLSIKGQSRCFFQRLFRS